LKEPCLPSKGREKERKRKRKRKRERKRKRKRKREMISKESCMGVATVSRID